MLTEIRVRTTAVVEAAVVVAKPDAAAQIEAFVKVVGARYWFGRRLRAQVDDGRRRCGRFLRPGELSRRRGRRRRSAGRWNSGRRSGGWRSRGWRRRGR